MKAWLPIALLMIAGCSGGEPAAEPLSVSDPAPPQAEEEDSGMVTASVDLNALFDNVEVAEAFAERKSGVQVQGWGTVSRLLSDDENGGRHQRFILSLESGQTLLVAHNIDVAPRIESLAVGDEVLFYGVYEWNDQGGLIHWTHHDPQGEHEAGWIRRADRNYD